MINANGGTRSFVTAPMVCFEGQPSAENPDKRHRQF
jgi:hypothetical protein